MTDDNLAAESLVCWDLAPDAKLTCINVSENTTYLVEGDDRSFVLRLHRQGYHSPLAIRSELAWIEALRASGTVTTPSPIRGRDGDTLQTVSGRHLVLFEYQTGVAPDPTRETFTALGGIAARLHQQTETWTPPDPFFRLTWGTDAVLGPDATWGHWSEGPNVSSDAARLLARVEILLRARLEAYGRSPERFGLIHADMRAANILLGPDGPVVIDFDDCGYGWHLYDFAAAVSFIEDHPDLPSLQDAWCQGYRAVRALSPEDERELATFVMFRRLALLGWIGSHRGAAEPEALAPHFADGTAALAERYLSDYSTTTR